MNDDFFLILQYKSLFLGCRETAFGIIQHRNTTKTTPTRIPMDILSISVTVRLCRKRFR